MNSLTIFGLSLVVVVALLVYIHVKIGAFLLESHRIFSEARGLIAEVDKQEKEIFHQNEKLVEFSRGNVNQEAVIKKLLTQIKILMEIGFKDKKKRK